jgi:ubiquinone/menaquinone biosynthesis C-methylase UbiE
MTDLSKLGHLNHWLPRDFNPKIRDKWIENIAKNIPEGSKIVDIASGNRPYMHLFSHCDYYSHEFEGNEQILDTFRGEIDKNKKHHYTGDITNLFEIEDESFDYVLCTEVLEHTPEPIKAIGELTRICKKGGNIILTAPFTSGLHQEPYHFYSGFSPHFYKYVANKYKNIKVKEISSQGDFFKLMSWFTNLAMQFRLPHSDEFTVNTVSHYIQSYYLTMSQTFGDSSGNLVDVSKHFTIGYMVIYEKI